MFGETFEECGLYDLGFSGYEFTWDNRREGDEIIEERLDRFCASLEWSGLFPDAEVFHLDERLSDHLPLLLKLKKPLPRRGRRGRRFMFENMWTLDEECVNIVQESWARHSSIDPWESMSTKLAECSTALTKWKNERFGHVQQQIRKLTEALKGEKDVHKRRETFNEISTWRRKEEIFWAQRAKADFLRHGDSNSKWFHARVKMRHKTNHIHGLQKEDGT